MTKRKVGPVLPHLYEYKVEVLRVHDGDTFEAEIDVGFNMRLTDAVRLDGVDTPELNNAEQHDRAVLARTFTYEWFYNAPLKTSFWIQSTKFNPREKYGRILAKVWRSGDPVDLASALIAAGHVK